jgi:hypothetical protein
VEGEADAAPRASTQTVAARAVDGHDDEEEDHDVEGDPDPSLHRRRSSVAAGDSHRDAEQERDHQEDAHRLQRAAEELPASAMVRERIAIHLRVAVMELTHLGLRPERVDAERQQREQPVHDRQAEECSADAVVPKLRRARIHATSVEVVSGRE